MTVSISCHRNTPSECEICDAARKNDFGTVEALLRSNPKQVFSRDDKGNTPLHVSASRGYLAITKLLLTNKADVNSRTDADNTPLEWAAYNGHTDVAALLIANGADVNAKDNKGWTPLGCAVYQGQRGTTEWLLANKAAGGQHIDLSEARGLELFRVVERV